MKEYAANSLPLSLGNTRRPLRITVVRTCGLRDIYQDRPPLLSPEAESDCPCFRDGDVFTVTDRGGKPPKDFPCARAWHSLFQDILALQLGGNFGRFAGGAAYASCSDGLHPVFFRLERLD